LVIKVRKFFFAIQNNWRFFINGGEGDCIFNNLILFVPYIFGEAKKELGTKKRRQN
jgi:hypothetical protein